MFGFILGLFPIQPLIPGHPGSVRHGSPLMVWTSSWTSHWLAILTSSESPLPQGHLVGRTNCRSKVLWLSLLSSLHILGISFLLAAELTKIFFSSVDCCFVLMTLSSALQKLFSVMRSYLLIVDISAGQAFGALFRTLSPVPMCSRLLPSFSSIRSSVC